MTGTTIAVIHTSPATVEVFGRLLAEHLPQARVVNLLDDSILPQLRDNGGDVQAVVPRWRQYAHIAEGLGATVILNACSSIGALCETIGPELGVPVVRVDRALAEEAVRRGRRIAVVATLASTLGPSRDLLASTAAAQQRDIEIDAILVDGAYAALIAGDRDAHDDLIADALGRAAAASDAVVLAQASMARVLPRLDPARQAKCLVSPPLAVAELVRLVGVSRGSTGTR
jgi:Asp/Glu/hydantoin racemase